MRKKEQEREQKKKHESKKQRKNRIKGHTINPKGGYKSAVKEPAWPRTFEEAVAMGILK